MGKLKLSIQLTKEDGTTVVQALHYRREMVRIDKNKEALFVDFDGRITIGKTNAIIENTGFIRVKNDNKVLAEYIEYQKIFGWCYTEERK